MKMFDLLFLFGLLVSVSTVPVLSRRRHNNRHSNDEDIGNGCSVSDVAWFNNFGSEWADLVTQSQNSGEGNSDELIAFAECNYLSSVNYTLVDPDSGNIIFGYSSVDEILNGNDLGFHGIVEDTTELLQGKIWLWGSAGFAKCYVDRENNRKIGTWTFRSGDNLRGDVGVNAVFLSRSTYTFVKEYGASSEDNDYGNNDDINVNCNKKWKTSDVFIEVLLDPYIIYAVSST